MMKKFRLLLIISLFSTFAYADFFNSRIFEICIDTPFAVTNNAFMLDNFLKEEAILDFSKIAKSLPKSGYLMISEAEPSVAVNFNIGRFGGGIKTGVEQYINFNISKDFFDFLGLGNELFQEMDFKSTLQADTYITSSSLIKFPVRSYNVKVSPTVFLPVLHFTGTSDIIVNNKEDGSITTELLGTLQAYAFSDDILSLGEANIPFNGLGFDIEVQIDFPFNDAVYATAKMRTPIIPGHLKYVSTYTAGTNLSLKASDLMNIMSQDFMPKLERGVFEPTDYSINRPFKTSLFLDISPAANFIHLVDGFGLGVRNPFTGRKEAVWYPEYYFGLMFKAGGIASCTFATEYTDQIFKHSIYGKLNLRFFELDTGIGAAATNIQTSFRGAGIYAYITTKFGF